MQSIHTKYLPATNAKGARIKAYTNSGFSAVIDYPDDLTLTKAHYEAVKALVSKHNLHWDISGMRHGDSSDGKGFTFCFHASTI
jgi:hypothetical protein